MADVDPEGAEPAEITLSNEYAQVVIRKVRTRKGSRVEISSPKLGYRILLDPIQLESLTWQDESVFTEFLRTPYGPEDHEE